MTDEEWALLKDILTARGHAFTDENEHGAMVYRAAPLVCLQAISANEFDYELKYLLDNLGEPP